MKRHGPRWRWAGWGDDHNSSCPLAVQLTLDRPSRNPEGIILEADSKVVLELRGARHCPQGPHQIHPLNLLAPPPELFPPHSTPRTASGPNCCQALPTPPPPNPTPEPLVPPTRALSTLALGSHWGEREDCALPAGTCNLW